MGPENTKSAAKVHTRSISSSATGITPVPWLVGGVSLEVWRAVTKRRARVGVNPRRQQVKTQVVRLSFLPGKQATVTEAQPFIFTPRHALIYFELES